MTASWKAFRDKELEKFVEIEEKALQELKWSEMSLPLSKFVKDYTMPQIVQIVDGYYSEEEDSSLSSGQILKIHCLKTVSKVFGCDQNGDDIHVPLNTPQKILTRPENYNHIYETVNDLVNAKPTPNFVEIIRGYYDPTGKFIFRDNFIYLLKKAKSFDGFCHPNSLVIGEDLQTQWVWHQISLMFSDGEFLP